MEKPDLKKQQVDFIGNKQSHLYISLLCHIVMIYDSLLGVLLHANYKLRYRNRLAMVATGSTGLKPKGLRCVQMYTKKRQLHDLGISFGPD